MHRAFLNPRRSIIQSFVGSSLLFQGIVQQLIASESSPLDPLAPRAPSGERHTRHLQLATNCGVYSATGRSLKQGHGGQSHDCLAASCWAFDENTSRYWNGLAIASQIGSGKHLDCRGDDALLVGSGFYRKLTYQVVKSLLWVLAELPRQAAQSSLWYADDHDYDLRCLSVNCVEFLFQE